MIRPLLRPLALLLAAAAGAGCGRAGPAPAAVPPAVEQVERSLAEGHYGAARRTLRGLPPASLPTREARFRAASAALRARDPSLAADLLREGGDEAARLLRAEGLVRSARFDEARSALDAMAKEGVGGERRRVLEVMLLRATGKEAEARAGATALVKGGSRDPDAHVLQAQEHFGAPSFAERLLLDALPKVDDRGPILKALGRLLLHAADDPRRAVEPLERAVRERPWDRDARLDLATALRRTGRTADLDRAKAEARKLREEDPDDFDASLVLAEVLGESVRSATAGKFASGAYQGEDFREALALYEELPRRIPAGNPALGMRVLLGLARIHVEAIFADDPAAATAEGTHYRRAMAALDAAWALDPKWQVRDARDVRMSAEVLFLRGRAAKRAHTGTMDQTVAVGYFEKALDPREGGDPRHLDARWDLGLLYADFYRSPEYIRKAAAQFEDYLLERERRGLPPLDAERMAIVAHVRALARKGLGLRPDEALGAPQPPGNPQPPK